MSTKDLDNFMARIENEPAPAIISNENYRKLFGGDLGSGLHLIRVKSFADGMASLRNIAGSVFSDEATNILTAYEETGEGCPSFKALIIEPDTPEGMRYTYTFSTSVTLPNLDTKTYSLEDAMDIVFAACKDYKDCFPDRRVLLVVNAMAFYMRQAMPDDFYPSDCQEQLQADREKLYWDIVRSLGQINIFAGENRISVVLATNLNYETEAYPVIDARSGEFLEG